MEGFNMKVFVGIFLLFTLLIFFFGNVKWNGYYVHGLRKWALSVLCGLIMALFIGLPICGVLFIFSA